MGRFFPFGGSGGGGGAGSPTGLWTEDVNLDDSFKIGTLLREDADVADALNSIQLLLVENANVEDVFSALVISNLSEDANLNDYLRLAILDIDAPRTGSPDNDLINDGWTDQASTGTNHGNESLIVKGKSTLASDERRGFLQIDLTQFGSWTAGGTAMTIVVKASVTGGLGDNVVSWAIKAGAAAAKHFTESTLTWANQPTAGTLQTGSFTATATLTEYTITLSAATVAACLGQWLLVAFTMATATVPATSTIVSRDSATSADRPRISLNYIQRGS